MAVLDPLDDFLFEVGSFTGVDAAAAHMDDQMIVTSLFTKLHL
jgi:hypothetical protein